MEEAALKNENPDSDDNDEEDDDEEAADMEEFEESGMLEDDQVALNSLLKVKDIIKLCFIGCQSYKTCRIGWKKC